jgi:hypothetical protein
MAVKISSDFGIVVRKQALQRNGIDIGALLSAMEAARPLDEDQELISFGPHFGEEAADEFARRLKGLGLEYVGDFFVFSADIPDWCGMSCTLAR